MTDDSVNPRNAENGRYSESALFKIIDEAMEPHRQKELQILQHDTAGWLLEVERLLNTPHAVLAFQELLFNDDRSNRIKHGLAKFAVRHKQKWSSPNELTSLTEELKEVLVMLESIKKRALMPLMQHSHFAFDLAMRGESDALWGDVHGDIHYAVEEVRRALGSIDNFAYDVIRLTGDDKGGRSRPAQQDMPKALEEFAHLLSSEWRSLDRDFKAKNSRTFILILSAFYEIVTGVEGLPMEGRQILANARKGISVSEPPAFWGGLWGELYR